MIWLELFFTAECNGHNTGPGVKCSLIHVTLSENKRVRHDLSSFQHLISVVFSIDVLIKITFIGEKKRGKWILKSRTLL